MAFNCSSLGGTMENTALKEEEQQQGSDGDVLIVVSKLKTFIRNSSGMNTSGGVPAALSAIVRKYCLQAIEKAKADGRKTVMERDFE